FTPSKECSKGLQQTTLKAYATSNLTNSDVHILQLHYLNEDYNIKVLSEKWYQDCKIATIQFDGEELTIEYSNLDGTNNNLNNPKAGSFGSPYLREVPTHKSFFSIQDSMIPSPGDYNPLPAGTTIKCSDPLPFNNYPLPRCISDIHNGYQTKVQDKFNWEIINSFKSSRKVSHMATFWGQMVGFDIANAKAAGEAFANGIIIPSDDTTYLSDPITDYSINQTSLPFTRSDLVNRQGVNGATSFIDASFLYGTNETRLRTELRDIGNRGKMKLITSGSGDKKLGYPPKSPVDGKYILGITSRASHVFTDMIQTILLREHNQRCDNLYLQNGEQWNDDMYFQEARRWIIALVQKITFKEYCKYIDN
ncbi:1423_t:CDS:2, partial [Entrophospora sp. SA101]